MKYDYLLVGAGLFSATLAVMLREAGKKCLIAEKRNHIAGNVYTENIEEIQIHKYGAHIFHTDSKKCWNFINRFAEFNRYTNSPIAYIDGKLYNLPFNMNTFNKIWENVITPEQAKKRIAEQINNRQIKTPVNLEEQAISLVGYDIYKLLIKEYTEKQWGRPCAALPPDIIKRLPLRFTYDNNYFNDRYQGIPSGGYTKMVERMLDETEVILNCDYLKQRAALEPEAEKIIYTGAIDEFYNYCYGELEYRSLHFETERLPLNNAQGVAVMNFTSANIPYTRIIEHKHFEPENKTAVEANYTYITKEYPAKWSRGKEPYYPINDSSNMQLYSKYQKLAQQERKIIFGGRLGSYRYFDMDDTIIAAMDLFDKIMSK